jgi:hypothetical protein
VRVYGVVDEETQDAVELFVREGDAAQFLADVRADEPELADAFRLEPV